MEPSLSGLLHRPVTTKPLWSSEGSPPCSFTNQPTNQPARLPPQRLDKPILSIETQIDTACGLVPTLSKSPDGLLNPAPGKIPDHNSTRISVTMIQQQLLGSTTERIKGSKLNTIDLLSPSTAQSPQRHRVTPIGQEAQPHTRRHTASRQILIRPGTWKHPSPKLS